jgi:hypothetical protein
MKSHSARKAVMTAAWKIPSGAGQASTGLRRWIPRPRDLCRDCANVSCAHAAQQAGTSNLTGTSNLRLSLFGSCYPTSSGSGGEAPLGQRMQPRTWVGLDHLAELSVSALSSDNRELAPKWAELLSWIGCLPAAASTPFQHNPQMMTVGRSNGCE